MCLIDGDAGSVSSLPKRQHKKRKTAELPAAFNIL
jgi:hypothetical protein